MLVFYSYRKNQDAKTFHLVTECDATSVTHHLDMTRYVDFQSKTK